MHERLVEHELGELVVEFQLEQRDASGTFATQDGQEVVDTRLRAG